ncbi:MULTISPECIES: response regulator transcription factor [unclassified Butyrivibrio]|jgi:DNA-binding response OmpR family regulator|uniref:response regulator transcription factor n=1 Tax=unclassified Butyrivibrio TaxID=2639466 RepID=UPI0004120D15|nr:MULTISPECIES: response regulator transcription factor [unclassified Butyrivibrio]
MSHILVVEDDVNIGNMLQEALEIENYEVTRAYSGTEALMILENRKPDLMLLDLMIPGISGEELIGKIDGVLTIVLSAKSDIDTKISLLKKGASDYVTKPFVISELLARIEAHLRLAESTDNKKVTDDGSVVSVGNISLDNSLFSVTNGDTKVSLTRTETAILNLLMNNSGRPLGRSTILDRISEDTPDCTERSLKQHVSNVRKKLQQLDNIDHIETIYGIGFQYNES